jgi:hypothetical protein
MGLSGEVSLASAATCDIGSAATTKVQITGTTTITSFGAVASALRLIRFSGALTLTHNATSLVLPGAANITTAAGDCALATSDSRGNRRIRHYQRASGANVRQSNVQTFTSSGTYTPTVGMIVCDVYLFSGGGGGGSRGCLEAASTACSGGGGGGGGAAIVGRFTASQVGASAP